MKRARTAWVGRLNAGDLIALGVATIVHASFLVAPLVIPEREPAVAQSSKDLEGTIDVVLLPVEPAPAAPVAALAHIDEAAPAPPPIHEQAAKSVARAEREEAPPARVIEAPAPIARIDPAAPRVDDAPPARAAEAPALPQSAPVAPADEYGGPAAAAGPATGAIPGLAGAAPVWTLPGTMPMPSAPAAAPTVAAKAPDVPRDVATQVLNGTLSKRDHEIGVDLPAAGIVANVISDAVRTASLPDDSRATFEVKLGSTGAVESVRVVSSTVGDAGVWGRVVGAAKASLASRSLSPPGEGGATVRVKIQSTQRFPSGAKKKADVLPVCANDVIDQIEEFLDDPSSAQAHNAVGPSPVGGIKPGIGGAPLADGSKRRICIPIGVGVRADLADIKAHVQTVVKSSVEVVRAGERDLPSAPALPLDDRAPWLPADPSKAARPPPPPRKKKKKPS